jgi:hypothetical protein
MIVPTLLRGNAARDALRHSRDAERPRRRSYAERGNASRDALRHSRDAERPRRRSHAERGDDQITAHDDPAE